MHLVLHFFVPLIISLIFFRSASDNKAWLKVYLIMMGGMLIDVDHLLASPIYNPGRCSIGFHPLHTMTPISVYFLMCFFKKTRILGIGLTIHIILDSIDCQLTNGVWWL
ncbi:DUF6122 family protein [Kangiella sp. HZ709]|uniref:DUF6122 family protein n=1 Tax=Kangiella sp. HZ709 TaxID=2666328 RepID=UPI0012B0918A|nr:DUF6122 family protein [Kangiella sp. HZ709]MRX28365.1 hypothetical protein [Kangiella sp. HZ709]